MRKHHSLLCHNIKVRRESALGTEKVHAVSTGRVQRDENDVGMSRRCASNLRRSRLAGLGGSDRTHNQEKGSQVPGESHSANKKATIGRLPILAAGAIRI